MTNYTKTNHRNPQDIGVRKANTLHLSRILLFLRKNKNQSYTMTEIKSNCCMTGRYALNGINFLLKEGFIVMSYRKYKGRANYNTKVYSIRREEK